MAATFCRFSEGKIHNIDSDDEVREKKLHFDILHYVVNVEQKFLNVLL